MDKPSLAQFVSSEREKLGITQGALAKRCSLELEVIENIECGIELFLSSTVRQKLAKGLKLNPSQIKPYEVKIEDLSVPPYRIEELKEAILLGEPSLPCPLCGQLLVTRVAKLYDLEDELCYHPKAHCSKCTFQIK